MYTSWYSIVVWYKVGLDYGRNITLFTTNLITRTRTHKFILVCWNM